MNKDDLSKLQKEWYQKLKDEGFEDIELNSNLELRQHGLKKQESNINNLEDKLEYARYGSQFLNDHEFLTEFDKNIWSLHLNGVSYHKIALECKTNRSQVSNILTRLNKSFFEYVKKRNKQIEEDKLLDSYLSKLLD